MTVTVRALSIARPWAALILHAGKDVENRTWTTAYRGLLVVHASQRWDGWPAEIADQFGLPATGPEHPTGYLGVVTLTAVHHAADHDHACSVWADGRCWHWRLRHPRPFPTAIPGPGRRGLFTPPPHVITAVEALRRAA